MYLNYTDKAPANLGEKLRSRMFRHGHARERRTLERLRQGTNDAVASNGSSECHKHAARLRLWFGSRKI